MFPLGTLGLGVAGATLLGLLRRRLVRNASPPGAGTRPGRAGTKPWRPADLVLVLGLVFVSLLLRVWNLEARVLDNDEPASFGFDGLDAWARERDARLHPPLSPLLMSAAFGVRALISDPRGVSVLAGIAVVVLAYSALRSAGRIVAIAGALLLAVSPAMLHASQLARGYALAAALVLGAHVALGWALRTGRERAWLTYTMLGSAALFSEYLTLVPILAEAAFALVSRRNTRTKLGVLTSVGGMVAIAACLAPFAAPTLTLGVGGPPRPASGLVPGLVMGLDLFGGAGGALLGGTCLALLVGALLSSCESHRRAAIAALSGALLLGVGGALTEVRARYVLPVFPLFFVACAAGAATWARSRGGFLGAPAAALSLGAFGAQLALLPCYLRQDCARSELARGRPPSLALDRLSTNDTAVVVVPSWSLAEPAYRLLHRFPGPDANRECPARLCVSGEGRALYGVNEPDIATALPELLGRHEQLYVLVRSARPSLALPCSQVSEEDGAKLFLCGATR